MNEPLQNRPPGRPRSCFRFGPGAIALLASLGVHGILADPLDACELPVCSVPSPDNPAIIADGVGGAFVAWRDTRGGNKDIYLQHLTAGLAVAPGWPVNGVPVVTAPFTQEGYKLVLDGMGGVIVVWEDLRGDVDTHYDIYAQRITAAGSIVPGWPENGVPLCVAPGLQRTPVIASDGAGGAIVAWHDERNATDTTPFFYADIYATRVTAAGTIAPGWGPNGNPVDVSTNHQYHPAVLADGAGGAILAWANGPPGILPAPAIRAQRLTGDGTIAPGWPAPWLTLCTGQWFQGTETAIVSDGVGGGIVVWLDSRNTPSDPFELDVFAHRVLADGTLAPGWPANGVPLCQAPDTQSSLDAMADGAGGALVVWQDTRAVVLEWDIYGQRITSGGSISPGWQTDGNLLAGGPGFQLTPRAALDGVGGVVFALVSYGGTYDLYSQRVQLDGTFPPGWSVIPRPLCVATNAHDEQPDAAPDGSGGLIVVATHVEPTANGIYAAWVPGGVVPTAIALVSAEALPDRVVLTWHGAESAALRAWVERRTESGAWSQVATILADGVGTLRYEDRDVRPGARYAYRLAYHSDGVEITTAEEWVTVPAPRFALAGARPNPVVGELVVGFSLSRTEPARIEVFDLAGRQVLARDASLGIGTHRLALAARGELPAGVYHLVLSQAEDRATTRAVVIR